MYLDTNNGWNQFMYGWEESRPVSRKIILHNCKMFEAVNCLCGAGGTGEGFGNVRWYPLLAERVGDTGCFHKGVRQGGGNPSLQRCMFRVEIIMFRAAGGICGRVLIE